MKYYIENKGVKTYYGTIAAAKAVCNEIFEKTGVVMGIEQESPAPNDYKKVNRNTDYIASGEYDGEFYLVEKLMTGFFVVSRHSDGRCFSASYKGTGFTSLTDLRKTVKDKGEARIVKVMALMGKYHIEWNPMYKPGILRDAVSAQAVWS